MRFGTIRRMQKIGILASGGDAPGMNGAIRAATRAALFRSIKVWGFWDGYKRTAGAAGRGDDDDQIRVGRIAARRQHPGRGQVRGVSSILRCAGKAVADLKATGFDGLIIVGGEGSLTGAWEMHKLGMPTICIPATIDNDMPGTEITIGADTAINTRDGSDRPHP